MPRSLWSGVLSFGLVSIPVRLLSAYHLAPQDGAEKPYRLLVKALDETGRTAIAKVVIRNKQQLGRVRAADDALVLETMYYADEVRKPDAAPKPRVQPAEVEMAKTLIENLAAEWDPTRYHDSYRGQLRELLEQKAEGEPLPEPNGAPEAEVVDLMEALRQSVAATKQKRKPARTAARKRKAS